MSADNQLRFADGIYAALVGTALRLTGRSSRERHEMLLKASKHPSGQKAIREKANALKRTVSLLEDYIDGKDRE